METRPFRSFARQQEAKKAKEGIQRQLLSWRASESGAKYKKARRDRLATRTTNTRRRGGASVSCICHRHVPRGFPLMPAMAMAADIPWIFWALKFPSLLGWHRAHHLAIKSEYYSRDGQVDIAPSRGRGFRRRHEAVSFPRPAGHTRRCPRGANTAEEKGRGRGGGAKGSGQVGEDRWWRRRRRGGGCGEEGFREG